MDATNREESAPPKGVTTATKGEARDLLSLETLSSAPAAIETVAPTTSPRSFPRSWLRPLQNLKS